MINPLFTFKILAITYMVEEEITDKDFFYATQLNPYVALWYPRPGVHINENDIAVIPVYC